MKKIVFAASIFLSAVCGMTAASLSLVADAMPTVTVSLNIHHSNGDVNKQSVTGPDEMTVQRVMELSEFKFTLSWFS